MNKLSLMGNGVMLAMGIMGTAYADNNSWTGFYVGGDAGVVFNDVQLKSQQLAFTLPSERCNVNTDFSSFAPGIQVGYLHQFPNFIVSGIEANTSINTNQENTLTCRSNFNPNVYDRFTFRNQMQTSIKGRVGRAWIWNKQTLFPYLTAGASFANVELTYNNEGGDYYSNSNTAVGWLLGVGIEWAWKQHWSLRAEYSYMDYGNAINLKIPTIYGLIDPNGNSHVNLSSNNLILAINYWI